MPIISSMIQWCETPSPRVNRPLQIAWMDRACWASATGCLGWMGTTAVPISMVLVARPASAAIANTSTSSGICGSQTDENPASSAHVIMA